MTVVRAASTQTKGDAGTAAQMSAIAKGFQRLNPKRVRDTIQNRPNPSSGQIT
jgi:hypothetical protein